MYLIQGTEFVYWPELGPGSNLSPEVNLGPLKACGLNRAHLPKKRRAFSGDRVTLPGATGELLGQMVQYDFHRGIIPPADY